MSIRIELDELCGNELCIPFDVLKLAYCMTNNEVSMYDCAVDLLSTEGRIFYTNELEMKKILMMIKLFEPAKNWTTNDATIAGKVCWILCVLIIATEDAVVESMSGMIDKLGEWVGENKIQENKYKTTCDLFMKYRQFITEIKKFPLNNTMPSYEWFDFNGKRCIKFIF
jgi:hypothetical protein